MSVWVRVQEGEFRNQSIREVIGFEFENKSYGCEHSLYGITSDNKKIILENYSSKEKCRKVMDMISDFIAKGGYGIYIMPPDEEVDKLYQLYENKEEIANMMELKRQIKEDREKEIGVLNI